MGAPRTLSRGRGPGRVRPQPWHTRALRPSPGPRGAKPRVLGGGLGDRLDHQWPDLSAAPQPGCAPSGQEAGPRCDPRSEPAAQGNRRVEFLIEEFLPLGLVIMGKGRRRNQDSAPGKQGTQKRPQTRELPGTGTWWQSQAGPRNAPAARPARPDPSGQPRPAGTPCPRRVAPRLGAPPLGMRESLARPHRVRPPVKGAPVRTPRLRRRLAVAAPPGSGGQRAARNTRAPPRPGDPGLRPRAGWAAGEPSLPGPGAELRGCTTSPAPPPPPPAPSARPSAGPPPQLFVSPRRAAHRDC